MAEVTRVPLQPIAKGSLTKLWLGVAIGILIGFGLAWFVVPQVMATVNGVKIETLAEGVGPNPSATDVVFVRYKGTLDDGTVFDESQDIPLPVEGIFPEGSPLPLDRMLPGFTEGAQKMQKGGKYIMKIPAEQAYGAEPPPGAPIPPNADLTFEIELVDFMSEQDFQGRLQQLQQMMAMQQGLGQQQGAEGQPPAPGQ
ncbi:FKBP-type peptidyl-prolyl cis-trans isomerase [Altererythrobacter sp. MF3-039]|uniref:FKBP-type peptidyl-prolyl cis-trans isomerase n=1 Tax=Altererythrobacter sp. MF3-039 TaxID=3252901 RepID=UPI00390C4BAD